MANKVWFITGTSKGFGRVWAEAALARGDRVAATARDVKSLAPLVSATVRKLPPSRWTLPIRRPFRPRLPRRTSASSVWM